MDNTVYNPTEIEKKWRDWWEQNGIYKFDKKVKNLNFIISLCSVTHPGINYISDIGIITDQPIPLLDIKD